MVSKKLAQLDKESTVCFLSADLQFLIRELKKKLKNKYKTTEFNEDLSLIASKVKTVQHKAQHMEKRLKKYRDSIESLGFRRSK